MRSGAGASSAGVTGLVSEASGCAVAIGKGGVDFGCHFLRSGMEAIGVVVETAVSVSEEIDGVIDAVSEGEDVAGF